MKKTETYVEDAMYIYEQGYYFYRVLNDFTDEKSNLLTLLQNIVLGESVEESKQVLNTMIQRFDPKYYEITGNLKYNCATKVIFYLVGYVRSNSKLTEEEKERSLDVLRDYMKVFPYPEFSKEEAGYTKKTVADLQEKGETLKIPVYTLK